MIPVLGVPVLNRPDLLATMLASVDVDVGRYVIVDNGSVTDDLPDDYWPFITVPPTNLGVAASWNFIIRTTPDASWWLLTNADVEFAPGDLERLCDAMEAVPLACLVEFGAFGISREVIDQVGWFDENYHPIYCEDTDYRWRCRLADVPILDVFSESAHVSSAAYRSDPFYAKRNADTYPQNVAYHVAKWGGGPRQERFRTPFDAGGDIRDWRLQLDRVRDLAWTR